MSGIWKYYRFDFVSISTSGDAYQTYGRSSTGRYGVTPFNSYEWDAVSNNWKLRPIADAPINVADSDVLYYQVDTATTWLGGNEVASQNFNISASSVEFASTGQAGGIFNGSSSGNYWYTDSAVVDGIISPGVSLTLGPPMLKFRVDNVSGSSSGYLTATIGIRRDL